MARRLTTLPLQRTTPSSTSQFKVLTPGMVGVLVAQKMNAHPVRLLELESSCSIFVVFLASNRRSSSSGFFRSSPVHSTKNLSRPSLLPLKHPVITFCPELFRKVLLLLKFEARQRSEEFPRFLLLELQALLLLHAPFYRFLESDAAPLASCSRAAVSSKPRPCQLLRRTSSASLPARRQSPGLVWATAVPLLQSFLRGWLRPLSWERFAGHSGWSRSRRCSGRMDWAEGCRWQSKSSEGLSLNAAFSGLARRATLEVGCTPRGLRSPTGLPVLPSVVAARPACCATRFACALSFSSFHAL